MSRCPKCGHVNPEGVENCQECGINQAWALENIKEACPACGTMNPPFTVNCSNCGFNLERDREKQQQEAKERELQERARGQTETDKKVLSKTATNALIGGIVGFFVCGVILGPYAITKAREAKKGLQPGDPGYGTAQVAEVIGWIAVVGWALVILVQLIAVIDPSFCILPDRLGELLDRGQLSSCRSLAGLRKVGLSCHTWERSETVTATTIILAGWDNAVRSKATSGHRF
jgi:ribosomal protein L40E